MQAIGITATDTDHGKTVVSACLAAALRQRGLDVGVFKPAASGCVRTADGNLVSGDAELLMKGAGLAPDWQSKVTPYVLEAALAPAEAAKLEGVELKPQAMETAARQMLAAHQITVVEGVGGLAAPLTEDYLVKDFFCALRLPVIIVVKPLLGNVNHAMLSAFYAQQKGLNVLGFIVNGWDEASAGVLERSNLHYYQKLTGLPILGKLPVLAKEALAEADLHTAGEIAAANIDVAKILALLEANGNE